MNGLNGVYNWRYGWFKVFKWKIKASLIERCVKNSKLLCNFHGYAVWYGYFGVNLNENMK